MGKLVQLPQGTGKTPTLAAAIEAFFADRDLAITTRRTYGVTFDALLEHVGSESRISELNDAHLRQLLDACWPKASPRTYNARIAALQSLVRYCLRQRWLDADPTSSLERHRVPRHESRAIAYEELEVLWSKPTVALREKLLWRCLYATAARTSEVLNLNIEDLDLGRKRAVITGKGGHRETIVWDAGVARLFPRYLAARKQGPVFVTYGQPNVVPAELEPKPGWSSTTVLSTSLGYLSRSFWRALDIAPATPQRADPFGGERGRYATTDGQVAPSRSEDLGEVCATGESKP